MSVVVSGILKSPDGRVVSGAHITLTALTVSPDALSGTGASAVTTASGYYGMTMEPGEYAVSVTVNGKTRVYGRIRIDGTESTVTLNMLLRRSLVEVSISGELLTEFRQIQNNVADDLATIRHLNEDTTAKNNQALQSKESAAASAGQASSAAGDAQAACREAERHAGIATTAAAASDENARRAETAAERTESTLTEALRDAAGRVRGAVEEDIRRAEAGVANAERFAGEARLSAEHAADSERQVSAAAERVSASLQQTLEAGQETVAARDTVLQRVAEARQYAEVTAENAATVTGKAREAADSASASEASATRAVQAAERAAQETTLNLRGEMAEHVRRAEAGAEAAGQALETVLGVQREVAQRAQSAEASAGQSEASARRAEEAARTAARDAVENIGPAAANAVRDEVRADAARAEAGAGRAEAARDELLRLQASTTVKGLVQLSDATDSDDETKAVTPKALKAVKDLADSRAPTESPNLTGTPTAPTAEQGTDSTQIANTAFVKAAITALISGAPGALDTLKEIASAINNDPNFSTTVNNALALKAPLTSPALTGIPTAPTAAQGTNNTQIATTAYVRGAVSALVSTAPETLDTLSELVAALGNDANFAATVAGRIGEKLAKAQNGADIPDKQRFRDNLGLGDSATRNTGSTSGTVAAGDDPRIVGAFQKPVSSLDVDLNSLGNAGDAGDYYQTSDGGATAARHYPVQKAGELRIRVGAWGCCQQEYTSWNPPRKFIRTVTGNFNGSGPWSDWLEVTAQDATLSQKGVVQLSSATDSDDETRAATPKAVKEALRLASQSAGPEIQDATTSRAGIVKLSSATNSTSESLAATPKAIMDLRDEILRTVVKDIRPGAARTVTVNTGETGASLGGPSLISRMVASIGTSDLIVPGGGGFPGDRPGDPFGSGGTVTTASSSGGNKIELTCHSVQKLINNQWLNVE